MRDRTVDPDALKRRRRAAGLTQAELATRVPCSLSFVKNVEGGVAQPGDLYAAGFATALGCTVEGFSDPKAAAGEAA